MRFALFLGILLSLFTVFSSSVYAVSDTDYRCSLDGKNGNLQRLTCFNETNISIPSGGIVPSWVHAYIDIPSNYTSKVLNLSVHIGIWHQCAADVFADLISPNGTRVRLSKETVSGLCSTEQFPGGEYTPIWVDNGTSMPSPWIDGVTLGTNDFNGTLGSFFGDNVSGTWLLNVTDPKANGIMGNVDFWAISIMTLNLSNDTISATYSQNITNAVDYYSPTSLSNFSVLWFDNLNSITTAYIENNFTGVLQNATMVGNDLGSNNFIFYYNVTLPAGLFNYMYYASDSAGNWNKSDVYYAGVNRSNASYAINSDMKIPGNPVSVVVGTESNITAFKNLQEGNITMFLDGEFIGTNLTYVTHIATLPYGNHIYKFVYNQTQNYSYNESELQVNVVKRAPRLSVINLPSNSHVYGTNTKTYCNITSGDASANIAIWYNSSLVSTGQGNQSFSNVNPAGIYNLTCSYSESQNFSGKVSYNNNLTVQRAFPILNLTFGGAESNLTISRCQLLNATAWTETIQGQINIYKQNVTNIVNPVNGSGNATYMERQCDSSGSVLNFTSFYPESQNYSANNKTFFAFIDSTNPAYSNNISSIQDSVSEDNFSSNFTISWVDNLNISMAFLENNFTGIFANSTMNGFGNFSYKTSVISGFYVYRFLANDTTDLWNSTEYIAFSVQYTAPVSNPPQNRGGGGGGGVGGSVTTTTTTTTSTTTTSTTTTTLPKVITVDKPSNKQDSGQVGNNNGIDQNNNQSSTSSDIITGAVVKNPGAVAASLVVLGAVAVNYFVGYDSVVKSSKLAKKKILKMLQKLLSRG
ncbi:MAG: proprotein convertase P-domain-containing protein [Candidatus Aenigmarchaeota archaeon]|nr:proprotein convertase P-domain-containing protein [Candidatus Aenigmarchaeota archaeon]